jgi:hypothetical protein
VLLGGQLKGNATSLRVGDGILHTQTHDANEPTIDDPKLDDRSAIPVNHCGSQLGSYNRLFVPGAIIIFRFASPI